MDPNLEDAHSAVPSRRMDAGRSPVAAMDDAALVTAAVDGDQRAFAELYDRYSDRVFSLCLSLTRDRGLAEDALSDTFVAAWQRLDQLRDRSQLRPWLFAIARNRVGRLGKRAAKQVPVDPVGPVMRDLGTIDDAAPDLEADGTLEREAAVALVWEAAEGLNENERAVLELQVRQGVTGEELATALGVTRHNANVIASRMRQNLERSIAALWLLRYDDGGCETFTTLTSDCTGSLTPLWRKRIARHVEGCEMCDWRSRTRALVLFGESPASAAPIAARTAVLDAVAASPVGVVDSSSFRVDSRGFPRSGPRLGRWFVFGAIAVVATIALLVTSTAVLGGGGGARGARTATTRTEGRLDVLGADLDGSVEGSVTTSTTVDGSTTTLPRTSTTLATAGRSPSTTTTTIRTGPPVITSVLLTPGTLYASTANCTRTTSGVLTVTATGPVGLRGGVATVTVGSVTRTITLSGSGTEVKGKVGPFSASVSMPALGTITASISVTDLNGATSTAWTGKLGSVLTC